MGAYTYQRCRRCRLLCLEPMPTLDTIERHYAAKFENGNYKALLTFSEQYRRVYRDYVSWMRRHVQLTGARSLDVGCFTGELVATMLDAGADAHGVELQPEAVAIAQQRLPNRVFEINIDSGSGPFADQSLDVVTMMAVIEHVQEPLKLLRRVRSLLKGGGWLFLETPNASSWPAMTTGRFWPLLAPVEHLHLFSKPAIRHALAQADFELVEVRPHIKWLSPDYVYEMLQYYGPEWRSIAGPVFRTLPRPIRRGSLFPFFAGEMLVAARAASGPTARDRRTAQ
jgi:2-polyprenyl-3-methyl-5-hydroxy-6-metoxy-1,4-benzoquinol methylase